jgi:lipoic acid synthetase
MYITYFNAINNIFILSRTQVYNYIFIIFVPIGKIITIQMPKVYDKVNVDIKPDWLKTRLHSDKGFAHVAHIVEQHGLHTICSSGRCPNKTECWSRRTATFMVMGDVCTRACTFCATASGKPLPLDVGEPERVASSISLMELKHAVITSVTRDDLADGGAAHWARVIEATGAANPHTTIEVLIPDMDGKGELLDVILAARPDITGHNIETVERLTPEIRSRARYRTSLKTLAHIASSGHSVAKSGIMVGLGETENEVLAAMDDLRGAGVDILTLGQYLRPTRAHRPVAEYVTPEKFEFYKQQALSRGFSYVASGPLVRSSYMAEQALEALKPRVQ